MSAHANRLQDLLRTYCGRLRAWWDKDSEPDVPDQPEKHIAAPMIRDKVEFDSALAFHQAGRLDDAESIYRALLKRQLHHSDALHNLGVLLAQRQNLSEAAELISRAIDLVPDNAAFHANLGNVLKAMARNADALASYDRALKITPADAELLRNRGALLVAMGRNDDALATYDDVLASNPGHHAARLKRCEILMALRRYDEALRGYNQILAVSPDDIEALFNHGVVLVALKRNAEAVVSYDKALALKPDFVEALNNRGIALLKDGQFDEAVTSYDRALAARPEYVDAHYNRGVVMALLNRHAEALASYNNAIVANPAYVKAFNNRGTVLAYLQQHDEALSSYDRALELSPDSVEVLNNRGGIFRKMGLHERAAQDYSRLLDLDKEYEHAAGNKLYSDLWGCDWRQFQESRQVLFDAVREGRLAGLPFQILVMSDSGADQLRCAKTYVTRKYPATAKPLWLGERYKHDRIRVAYLSADFRDHATTQLMAELFEEHDAEKFEVSAWSFGPSVKDAMRERLQKSFEYFNDVRSKSDIEVAAMLRGGEIDIAVDLKGFTDGCRPSIFVRRAAPVQVNYLGYPGTTGADYMDYIVGDAEVIPVGHEAFYTEKVVRLPDAYQVNDSKRVISERVLIRTEAKLPEFGFVFCCFNNNYKITPDVFDIWMRLLKRVDGSVLWLLEDNAAVARNLRLEAKSRGVQADRLVFAARVLPPDHLARHKLADLFLDTLPCNAHTTASDALWAGLPVLTCRGNAFPGRVAASLLRAIGLPELITDNLADYEALALKLATTPSMLNELKAKLARNRDTYPLFDTDRFRRHIESAYVTMYERYQRGEPPESFSVTPIDAGEK